MDLDLQITWKHPVVSQLTKPVHLYCVPYHIIFILCGRIGIKHTYIHTALITSPTIVLSTQFCYWSTYR